MSKTDAHMSVLFRTPKQQAQQTQQMQQPTEQPAQEKPYVWRMYSQTERKYQLFPKDKQQLPPTPETGLDPEQAFALAMGQNSNGAGADKTATPPNGLRLRIKEHNLTRRRKVSVPELGPMTTVQEIAMDSPTIPGRPPLHERSISAPGTSWRQHHLVDCMIPQTVYDDETSEPTDVSETQLDPPRCNSAQAVLSPSTTNAKAAAKKAAAKAASAKATLHHPLSPKSLTPLVIPAPRVHASCIRPAIAGLSGTGRGMRSGSNSADSALRSARSEDSPRNRTPFTPLSASLLFTAPPSAVSATSSASTPLSAASTLPTPLSAITPMSATEPRASPKPRAAAGEGAEKMGEKRAILARSASTSTRPAASHRRGQSESGSIMERGRPRKRSASREGASTSLGIASSTTAMGTSPKQTASLANRSAERRAFELLPRGWKAPEAAAMLGTAETMALATQALQQAARFEVLRREDVESLSRELRSLDERTEYLRSTYTSLRSGRRNLHSRICQYLRSPRVARFSHDAMLRQEEALAELDASIDDWVTKLEQAENRRTRVRQKLLEHVAAAATLPLVGAEVSGVSESLQMAMGLMQAASSSGGQTGVSNAATSPKPHHDGTNMCTPPRSPTKAAVPTASSYSRLVTPVSSSPSPSPQRPIVARVPSAILEQPMVEEAMAMGEQEERERLERLGVMGSPMTSISSRRVDVESIRIYAGDDVYTLLADVESQITQMGGQDGTAEAGLSDEERKNLHRAHSHELLNGRCSDVGSRKMAPAPAAAASASAARTASPPPVDTTEIFLTSAVFQPERSVLAI
ncbi:hypothetical protein CMQ_5971 [Grosmannia clavigera kw1407]|uniref:Up-regulated during septation protein 1 domain-containing protein n=1 Tax=Grosmannia clavigera (strain kw1407 / UAMH 11150) TaxID=655863 RepID=F0XLR1_GROCL|nr:uncharacterized protein CMQ_5971 [Grosmannia clavigera kw1407]EFX01029.1 hypothetical protein CMQ_5971 [Grosmannia clavigera kw1407]